MPLTPCPALALAGMMLATGRAERTFITIAGTDVPRESAFVVAFVVGLAIEKTIGLRAKEEDEIAARVKKTLNDALTRADESPLPDPETLLEGVYATPEDLDTPHHK